MSNTPVKRCIGRYEYDVYESKIPDAKTPKDRLTHPGWRQAFAHHP